MGVATNRYCIFPIRVVHSGLPVQTPRWAGVGLRVGINVGMAVTCVEVVVVVLVPVVLTVGVIVGSAVGFEAVMKVGLAWDWQGDWLLN